jgi:hypothetical protein
MLLTRTFRSIEIVGGTLLVGLVTFALNTSGGVALALAGAAVVGAASLLFVRLIDLQAGEAQNELTAMLMAGSAAAVSWGLKALVGSNMLGWHDGTAVLVAMGTAWACDVMGANRTARVCFICKSAIGDATHFSCPRCQQLVCSRPSCWMARRFRCRSCDEREVVAFPIDERWWRARLGARVSTGSCGSCYKEAGEADLRECGQCHWPMCKRCWDYHNGQCTHCEWTVPDLPKALQPFMGASQQVNQRQFRSAERR